MMNLEWLTPTAQKLFFKKNDPEDPRLGEFIKTQFSEAEYILLGYPDDEGISIHHGRPGAAQAPDKIREIFYKLTPASASAASQIFPALADLGNLKTDLPLIQRHEHGRNIIHELHKQQKKTISLGGGHDYGYADTAGFCDYWISQGARPLIINVDAHLDVRPDTFGPSSGTPFFRLLNLYGSQIDFIEIGIQKHCSAAAHHQFVLQNRGLIYTLDWISEHGLRGLFADLIHRWPAGTKKQPVFLSLDIDAFASHEAPGCSQSWPVGLSVKKFWPFYKKLLHHFSIHGLGIYEVSPPLDMGLQTQRLAALLAYEFIIQSQDAKSEGLKSSNKP